MLLVEIKCVNVCSWLKLLGYDLPLCFGQVQYEFVKLEKDKEVQEILMEFVESTKPDMLVVGTHQRNALKKQVPIYIVNIYIYIYILQICFRFCQSILYRFHVMSGGGHQTSSDWIRHSSGSRRINNQNILEYKFKCIRS